MKLKMIIVVVCLVAASCSSDTPLSEEQEQQQAKEESEAYSEDIFPSVMMIDGKELQCAVFVGHRKGGLSCNWEAWNEAN